MHDKYLWAENTLSTVFTLHYDLATLFSNYLYLAREMFWLALRINCFPGSYVFPVLVWSKILFDVKISNVDLFLAFKLNSKTVMLKNVLAGRVILRAPGKSSSAHLLSKKC